MIELGLAILAFCMGLLLSQIIETILLLTRVSRVFKVEIISMLDRDKQMRIRLGLEPLFTPTYYANPLQYLDDRGEE